MIVPVLLSRVKQRDDVTGLRVDSGKIRSLVAIAVTTGAGQIFWHAGTAVLERNNVIEMERRLGEGFREAAIFASVPGSGADGCEPPYPRTDSAGGVLVQRKACFRLEKLQGSADIEIVIQLTLFDGRQLADVRLFRKLANTLCVGIRDAQSQPLASGLGG